MNTNLLFELFNQSNCQELIDDLINKNLYYPPKSNTLEEYEKLNNNKHQLICIPTNNKNNDTVPLIKILPTNNKIPDKYIIFSHGNSSDIFNLYHKLEIFANKLNIGIITYDYIGYGLSNKAKPSEENCYLSMNIVMTYVLSVFKIDRSQIYLIGQSLGTGVVIEYVYNNEWIYPIILISPYKSICTVKFDNELLSKYDKFKNLSKLNKIDCPVKIFHGHDDTVINISHSKMIYESLKNKSLKPAWLNDTGHGDIIDKVINISKNDIDSIINYEC